MEALLQLYINLEKELAFLWGIMDRANPVEFDRLNAVVRYLLDCKANLKSACDRMSDGYSGAEYTKYYDIVQRGLWREYEGA
jgi:hypothetical protein